MALYPVDIRAIPHKNTPPLKMLVPNKGGYSYMPKSAKNFRLRRAKKHRIFVFSCPQIPKKFASGGPKTHIFNVFMHLDTQNSRLRRAKKLHIPCWKCFLECRSAPLSFAKLNLKQICANHAVFTVAGTHFYHSRNKTGAARAQFPFVLRV